MHFQPILQRVSKPDEVLMLSNQSLGHAFWFPVKGACWRAASRHRAVREMSGVCAPPSLSGTSALQTYSRHGCCYVTTFLWDQVIPLETNSMAHTVIEVSHMPVGFPEGVCHFLLELKEQDKVTVFIPYCRTFYSLPFQWSDFHSGIPFVRSSPTASENLVRVRLRKCLGNT